MSLSPWTRCSSRTPKSMTRPGTSRPKVIRAPASRAIAIEHLHPVAEKDARLGRAVLGKAGVAVEVVLGEVEHRCRVRQERPGGLQLIARELEHPDGGHRAGLPA